MIRSYRLLALLRRFRDKSGVAFVEFALSVPILLGVSLMGFEIVNLVLTHLRVNSIAMMTADNASRVRESIDEANVHELFEGAKESGKGIKFAEHGRLILTDLEEKENGGGQWIRWQRCIGGKPVESSYGFPLTKEGEPIRNGTEIVSEDLSQASAKPSAPDASTLADMGPDGQKVAAANGGAVMVVEAVYDYQPIFRNILGDIEIRYLSAFDVRERTNQILTNGGKVTPARCDQYSS